MLDNAVYRDGLVAIQYYQPVPKLVSISGNQYYFDCQHGISLAWVKEPEVPGLLAFRGGCCGGSRLVFHLATESSVKHWADGQGGR